MIHRVTVRRRDKSERPGGFWPGAGAFVPVSRQRAAGAFAVAVASDLLSLVVEIMPLLQIAVDLTTALVLWVLLGWRWALLPALVAEAIPMLGLFPTWTMVAGAYWWYSRPDATGGR